jgi:hypothetical protein
MDNIRWQDILAECLGRMGKTSDDVASDKKAVPWKIAAACYMKENTGASNTWIAWKLNMGVAHAVSRYVGDFRKGRLKKQSYVKRIIAKV